MATYPLIECEIVIGGGKGETSSIVPRTGLPMIETEDGPMLDEADRRLTPAEALILLNLHGWDGDTNEGAIIRDPMVTGEVNMREGDLRVKLYSRYGRELVDRLFPGPLPTTCDYPSTLPERLPEAADPPASPEPISEKKRLQIAYEMMSGKKPFGGWNEAELRERIAKANAPEPEVA